MNFLSNIMLRFHEIEQAIKIGFLIKKDESECIHEMRLMLQWRKLDSGNEIVRNFLTVCLLIILEFEMSSDSWILTENVNFTDPLYAWVI